MPSALRAKPADPYEPNDNMNRLVRFALCILLLLVANAGYPAGASCPPVAEKPTAEALQAAARQARDHGFLWRISKDGRTSFLYGTMHVGKLDWAVPGPSFGCGPFGPRCRTPGLPPPSLNWPRR